MNRRRLSTLKKVAVMSTVGTAFAFPFGACENGQFTTVQSVTLDSRQVVTYLVSSAILNPLNNWINNAVNAFFEQAEND